MFQCCCRSKLNMELYVIHWLVLKKYYRTHNRSMIWNVWRNNDMGYIRNIQIKCLIIVIVQHTIVEHLPFIVQSQNNLLKSIFITHPHNIDCRITNNHPCIFYEHLVWLPITGHFSKWGLLTLNRVNNNRALFKVRSPIKIQSTPSPSLGQLFTLTGYNSVLT